MIDIYNLPADTYRDLISSYTKLKKATDPNWVFYWDPVAMEHHRIYKELREIKALSAVVNLILVDHIHEADRLRLPIDGLCLMLHEITRKLASSGSLYAFDWKFSNIGTIYRIDYQLCAHTIEREIFNVTVDIRDLR